MAYGKSAMPTLASPANPAPAIESTRLPGKEIRESISKMPKVKAKPYQVRQVLAAIERLEAENG